jgi:hypothetical protein
MDIKQSRPNRSKVISLKVTEGMYRDLTSLAFAMDMPVSTVCFLAVRKLLADKGALVSDEELSLL